MSLWSLGWNLAPHKVYVLVLNWCFGIFISLLSLQFGLTRGNADCKAMPCLLSFLKVHLSQEFRLTQRFEQNLTLALAWILNLEKLYNQQRYWVTVWHLCDTWAPRLSQLCFFTHASNKSIVAMACSHCGCHRFSASLFASICGNRGQGLLMSHQGLLQKHAKTPFGIPDSDSSRFRFGG